MSWLKRLFGIREPESLAAIRGRYEMDERIWKSLTDSQLALAWCDASLDTDRGRVLSFICAQRLWEKNKPKPVSAANCILPEVRTFSASLPISMGSCIYVQDSTKQTITKKKKRK